MSWTRAAGLPEVEPSPEWAPVPVRPAADRVNPNLFYVFDAQTGQAFSSTDGGAHFTPSSSGLPALAPHQYGASSAQATPGVPGDLWLTAFSELHHSIDAGRTYQPIPAVTEATALGFGKAPPGKGYPALYLIGKVGDVSGLFRSDDGGHDWMRIDDDRHRNGSANVITGDPRLYGRVYVGTVGRGILYGDPK